MRRREFIGLFGGAVTAWPLAAARAREAGDHSRRIGLLSGTPLDSNTAAAFEQGLRDLGWRIGQDITIEYRFAEGHFDRLPGLAAELVSLKVELILAVSAPQPKERREVPRSYSPYTAIQSEQAMSRA
jgi:putative ABC transport system substrate-binding protein